MKHFTLRRFAQVVCIPAPIKNRRRGVAAGEAFPQIGTRCQQDESESLMPLAECRDDVGKAVELRLVGTVDAKGRTIRRDGAHSASTLSTA